MVTIRKNAEKRNALFKGKAEVSKKPIVHEVHDRDQDVDFNAGKSYQNWPEGAKEQIAGVDKYYRSAAAYQLRNATCSIKHKIHLSHSQYLIVLDRCHGSCLERGRRRPPQ